MPVTLSEGALFVSIKLFNYRSTFQLLFPFLSAQPARRMCVCEANRRLLRTVQPYATDKHIYFNVLLVCDY